MGKGYPVTKLFNYLADVNITTGGSSASRDQITLLNYKTPKRPNYALSDYNERNDKLTTKVKRNDKYLV